MLTGIDFLEIYSANLPQAVALYRGMLGFQQLGAPGPEGRMRGHRSVLLGQGDIRLVITAADGPDGPVSEYVRRHGDGIKDIALSVADVAESFHAAVARGARPVLEPTSMEGEHGRVVKATIAGPGDLVHSFIQREGGPPRPAIASAAARGAFTAIDHVALCLEVGTLDATVDFYRQVFGFRESHHERVELGRGGMNSKVVQSPEGRVKFPLQVPLSQGIGQIAAYLQRHGGPGVQHVAFLSGDMVHSLQRLRENRMSFLASPSGYYDAIEDRLGAVTEDLGLLRALDILLDRDESGYLLQVFTRSVHERRTLFFEVIQRKGAFGFGSANIRALYAAVEHHQETDVAP